MGTSRTNPKEPGSSCTNPSLHKLEMGSFHALGATNPEKGCLAGSLEARGAIKN